jgi:hypothetical protein
MTMENKQCPAFVDGKKCDLLLTQTEQELETGTVVFECPVGHRTYVPLHKIEKRKCSTLVEGKECSLPLTQIAREIESATVIYECPLGHRTYVPLEEINYET